MSSAPEQAARTSARVGYDALVDFTTAVFAKHGVPGDRARVAARALCHGDLAGMASHGLVNLTRLYLPRLRDGRIDGLAEPRIVADRGASVLVDARRALGLWHASEAVELAAARAEQFGIGMVSVRDATHCGCAGHHAARAVAHGMIGAVASNCGEQRIARPPDGRLAMLGTNPLSVAAPAGEHHPFVLDMSTTVVPTGRIREAARAGDAVPAGWLADDGGEPVTDPAAFDRGDAHLLWLGAHTPGGAYKGFGLGIVVELLAALVAGAGFGPAPAAMDGDGGPHGTDDDIGLFALAIAPHTLRPWSDVRDDAQRMFGALLDCPPVDESRPVRYPGWHEAERAIAGRRDGVLLPAALYDELRELAAEHDVAAPALRGAP